MRIDVSEIIQKEKHREPGENRKQHVERMARALADDNLHYYQLVDIFTDGRFYLGGRAQAAVGSPRHITAHNCFVSGTIPDSFTEPDNPEQSSIMHRAVEAAMTMRMGGGIGYDVSTMRPERDLIKKLQSLSSGPLGFMPIFDAVCKATASAGNRRGAQMGIIRVDHPDVLKFVRAKQNTEALTGFNLSVAVTDKFMEALAAGRTFELKFGGRVYGEMDAAELWDEIMKSTWDWAEPGVQFIDTINRKNNLWYCETIAATNPCSEQPLPPFGACLLGSFNLTAYILPDGTFDIEKLVNDVWIVVRAVDNVIDRSLYPLPEQHQEQLNKRRMGLGVMGLANVGEVLGHPYGSDEFVEWASSTLEIVNRECYRASVGLAKERGPFPYFDAEKYLRGEFIQTLDDETRDLIRRHGIRNSCLTSLAPTGTISLTAGNVSSGIEPVYRWRAHRRVKFRDEDRVVDVYDWAFENREVRGRRAAFGEVTVQQHLDVMIASQSKIDSSVAKTVNTDGSVPWEDFKDLYREAYERGAKCCSTFNKDGRRFGIFEEEPEPDDLPFPGDEMEKAMKLCSKPAEPDDGALSCTFDPATGRKTCE